MSNKHPQFAQKSEPTPMTSPAPVVTPFVEPEAVQKEFEAETSAITSGEITPPEMVNFPAPSAPAPIFTRPVVAGMRADNPDTPTRIRCMANIEPPPVVGTFDFFRVNGSFVVGKDVTVPRFVAEALVERGSALIY